MPAGVSTASTVPASSPALAVHKSNMRAAAQKEAVASLKTPPCKNKGATADDESRPKLRRDVQSRQIIKEELDRMKKHPAPKRTCAKAKAAPVGERGSTAAAKAQVKRSNTTDSSADAAVGATLRRGLTKCIEDTQKAAAASRDGDRGNGDGDGGKHGNNDHAEDDLQTDDDDPQNDAEAVELARIKRANHARFMWFSRSLKSDLASTTKDVY